MHLVVQDEFISQKKVLCQNHSACLQKVPIDYQVYCCNENEHGEICRKRAIYRCPVGLNQCNRVHNALECRTGMCISFFKACKDISTEIYLKPAEIMRNSEEGDNSIRLT